MDVRTAVLRMIASIDGGWPVAASQLGMTEAALRNRAYGTKGQSLAEVDKFALQNLSQTTWYAEAVATASGGTFVKLPEIDAIENDSIQAMFNQNYADLGKLFTLFTEAVADGEIDDVERARLQSQGEELHRKTEMLLAVMFSIYCRQTSTVKLVRLPREVVNG